MTDTSNNEVLMSDLPIDLCYEVARFNFPQQWYLQANLGRNHYHGVRRQIADKLGVVSEECSGLLNLFDWDEFAAMKDGFEQWLMHPDRPITLLSDQMLVIPNDDPSHQESSLTGQVRMVQVDKSYWHKHGPQWNQDAPQAIEITRSADQIAVLNLRDYEVYIMDTHGDFPYVMNDHLMLLPRSNDGQIRIYEISNEKKLKATFEWPKDLANPWFNLLPLSIDKDGNVYYVSHGDRHSVKSLANPGVTHHLLKSEAFSLSQDSSVALDQIADKEILLINTQTWKEFFRMEMPFEIRYLRLSPNADYIAVLSEDHWWIVDVQNRFLKRVDVADVSFDKWLSRDLFSVKTNENEYQLRRAEKPRKVIARETDDPELTSTDEPFSFTKIHNLDLHRNTIWKNDMLYMLKWEEK